MDRAYVIFVPLFCNFIGRSHCAVPSAVLVNFTRAGDFMLGGLFPLHRDVTCRGGRSYHLLERVETMAFAIEEINGRGDLLANVSLGFDIRESCYRDDSALWSALSLLGGYSPKQEELKFSTGETNSRRGRLIGIVGTSRSSTSVVASKATNIYDVPMVSGFATSDELSDKDHFPNFLRTSPPDKQQGRAIVDVLLHFDWRYIGMIYSLDTYGIHGTQELLSLADQKGICVAFSMSVRKAATASEIDESVRKIEEFDKAGVVVMFGGNGGYEGMYFILQEFYRANPDRRLVLIGSDSFENFEKYGVHETSQGSLFFSLNIFSIPGFEKYFGGLSTTNSSPWFPEYMAAWMEETGCVDPLQCSIPVSNRSSPVYHAVYAFAHALNRMLQNHCGPGVSGDCPNPDDFDGREFLAHLRNVTFTGVDGGRFHFDANGDPDGTYTVSSFRGNRYYKVGQWDSRSPNDSLSINVGDILWPAGLGRPPSSLCVEECKPGYVAVPLEKKCCRGCKECPPNAIVDGSSCIPCGPEFWPNELRSQCRPIAPSKADIADAAMVVVIIMCVLGLCLSLLSLSGLWHYRNHPLIKATSRELSCITLVGTLLAFLSVATSLSQPTIASCAAGEATISLCFTLTYAPTLLKVNRILRIFRSSKKSTKRPALVRPKDQLMLAALLIAVQVVVVIVSILVGPSTPKFLIPQPPQDFIEVYCDFGRGFIASCAYNLFLILACCYYAFRARMVPSNYNESKFIAVSVYSTLVLCLAAVPVYTTAVAVLQKVATLCLALLINAILTLVCVYLPKLYAAKFLKDVRVMDWSSSMGSTHESTVASSSRMQPSIQGQQGGATAKVGPAET